MPVLVSRSEINNNDIILCLRCWCCALWRGYCNNTGTIVGYIKMTLTESLSLVFYGERLSAGGLITG